jgi:hypothetical protein
MVNKARLGAENLLKLLICNGADSPVSGDIVAKALHDCHAGQALPCISEHVCLIT